jgi:hypothetical protein
LLLWQLDDILLAGGTLLPVNEPFTQAVDMENVVTDRNLHQLFFLLKVTQTELALGLLYHIELVPWIVKLVGVWILIGFKSYSIHNLEVDRHHSFNGLNILTVVLELAIRLFSVERAVVVYMVARLLAVHQDEAKQLDQHDQQEDEN